MFTKKSLLALLLCGAMALPLAACSSGTSKAASPAAGSGTAAASKTSSAKFVMKIGHSQPTDNPRHISLLAFKKEVEEKTNGGVSVEIYPSGQLGSEKEMLESVKMGTLQGMRGGQFDMLPKLLVFTLPFLCQTDAQVDALLDSDAALKICEESKKDNMYILGLGNAGGWRQFSNNRHPIKTPADLKGLKMRTPGMDTIDGTFKAMGATTVSVPYNDLYMSLKTGVADGQENPLTNMVTMKFYEVQKYVTMVNYMFHPDPFYVNKSWFDSLPSEDQEVIKAATKNMMKVNNDNINQNDAKALETVKQHCEVYTPTADELQQFKDASNAVYDTYLKQGKITQDELDNMRNIVKQAK